MKRSARPKRVEVQLAPMQPEDIAAVLAIEQQSFTMPWTEAMFRSELRNERTSHMLVARVGAADGPWVVGSGVLEAGGVLRGAWLPAT